MQLTYEQLESVTLGAASTEQAQDGMHFYRFTQEQAAIYHKKRGGFCTNTLATSGIKLSFSTDSTTLKLCIGTKAMNSRNYFSADIFVNGKRIGDMRNFEEDQLPRKYTTHPLPLGDFSESFCLGDGNKDVLIHLPWSVETVLKDLSLDDGASFTPIIPGKKLLCFGDSITQGFDALHPSRRYTARLADYLGMEEYNKAIGGEIFLPEIANTKESFVPDFITVAYGTNDWRHRERDVFENACRLFFENLTRTYPDTPILAIAPLWRKIWEREMPCGPYRSVEDYIQEVTAPMKNVSFVSGFDFIPHEPDYFGDLTLHPNGAGFDRYFEGLKTYFESR